MMIQNTNEVTSTTQTETDYLTFLSNLAYQQGSSLALWRLPRDKTRHLILSNSVRPVAKTDFIEELPAGFIFSPFNKQDDGFFLKADYAFSFADNELKAAETPLENDSQIWLADQQKKNKPGKIQFRRNDNSLSEKDQQHYLTLVHKSIAEIEKGTIEKIVPSRFRKVPLPQGFDVIKAFEKLCNAYPDTLVSFVYIPDVGTWMGATPEVLVSVEDNTIFKTVALAGTLPYHEGMNLRSVAWTQKEIEEQALVERYIISCFKKIRLREYDEYGPKTVVAGNVMHLRSDFTVNMKETGFPQLGSLMLQLLHPTSAVCGMPLENALAFLKENEGYERDFYSGFLGPVNFNNNICLFVNLRCMQLLDDCAILYAGAGVTIDSIPEKELEETEFKLNTLYNVIF